MHLTYNELCEIFTSGVAWSVFASNADFPISFVRPEIIHRLSVSCLPSYLTQPNRASAHVKVFQCPLAHHSFPPPQRSTSKTLPANQKPTPIYSSSILQHSRLPSYHHEAHKHPHRHLGHHHCRRRQPPSYVSRSLQERRCLEVPYVSNSLASIQSAHRPFR